MLVRNALDVAIEDIDPRSPDHPLGRPAQQDRLGLPRRDLRAPSRSSDDGVYRLRGRRGNVHFFGLQVAAGIRTLANAHADEWDLDADGRFELIVGGPPRERNWLPLEAGARWIFVRQFFYDWERERPSPLWIDRIDDGPNGRAGERPARSRPPSRGGSTRSRRTSRRASNSGSAPCRRCASAT